MPGRSVDTCAWGGGSYPGKHFNKTNFSFINQRRTPLMDAITNLGEDDRSVSIEELRFRRSALEPLCTYRGHISGVSAAAMLDTDLITGFERLLMLICLICLRDVYGNIIVYEAKAHSIKLRRNMGHGILTITCVGRLCVVHCRDGKLYSYDGVDFSLVWSVGQFSYCKICLFECNGRILLTAPNTVNPEMLDIWDPQSRKVILSSIKASDNSGIPLF